MWQTASDFIVFVGWVWQNLFTLIGKIFIPVRFIYTYLKSFVVSAFATPPEVDVIWSFPANIMGLFQGIPYWNVLLGALVIGIFIILIVFIFKILLKT
jgi:hypothetical protein